MVLRQAQLRCNPACLRKIIQKLLAAFKLHAAVFASVLTSIVIMRVLAINSFTRISYIYKSHGLIGQVELFELHLSMLI